MNNTIRGAALAIGAAVTMGALVVYDVRTDAAEREALRRQVERADVLVVKTGYARPDMADRDTLYPDELPLYTLIRQELARAYGTDAQGKPTYATVRGRIEELNPGYRWGNPSRNLKVPDLNGDGKFGSLDGMLFAKNKHDAQARQALRRYGR